MPLPMIHTAIHSLPPSNKCLCLPSSLPGNTHSLLQVPFACFSASCHVSNSHSLWQMFCMHACPLSAPQSLVVAFAPSDVRSPGSSHYKISCWCLGSHRSLIDFDSLAGCCSLSHTPALALHVLAMICTTPFHTPSQAASATALLPTDGQWIPPLPPNVMNQT